MTWSYFLFRSQTCSKICAMCCLTVAIFLGTESCSVLLDLLLLLRFLCEEIGARFCIFYFLLVGLICVNFIFHIVNSTCFNINELHFMSEYNFQSITFSFHCTFFFHFTDFWKTNKLRLHFIYLHIQLMSKRKKSC